MFAALSEEEMEKKSKKVDDWANEIFKDLAVDAKELKKQKEDADIVGKFVNEGWGDEDLEIKL